MQTNSQYQHYIPQFILRNFSHRYKPLKRNGHRKHGGSRPKKGMRKGDKVLNVVDLTSDESQLREEPVSRWFGQMNMYNDTAAAINSQKNIEEELSKLESRTAEILQKVKKAHEAGEPGIYLNRSERNRLRKFLFIMKYRGPGFYGKYLSGDQYSYTSEDRNLLRSYMTEKGFENPRDVWLHNLHAILDLEMDAEGKWMTKLPEVMFPADAAMFTYHVQSSYTAFCTPDEDDDEFILTDQCYNVFEGPIHEATSPLTGEDLGSTYLCFHEFGPISSRLIIVLRSFVLPEALEDANHKIREAREMFLEGAAVQFPRPENVKSILADLPVAKAMNSYMKAVDGKLELAPGETGKARHSDKFCFRFWPIKRKHVYIINSIFLDNVLHCKSIVFRSAPSFKRTLEAYMTTDLYGFKKVGVGERGARISRRMCLQKLSTVLKALGSDNAPIWHDDVEANQSSYLQSIDDSWLEIMKKFLKRSMDSASEFRESHFWGIYSTLGGTKETFVKDLEQSWRLYRLQALVFNVSWGLDGHVGRQARVNVVHFIVQFHPRRVWLYMKHLRWMLSEEYARLQETYIGIAPIVAAKSRALIKPGPEDDIVKLNPGISHQRLSRFVFAVGGFDAITGCRVEMI
ncbi:hypothetical protein Forpe1208_v015793 [Fusarium oxysporum f. sp. rapae]|uniref:Uncharacterized protein n=1 Tax=Fusarium oxysporum f. sp. rapae TaxID=485398 RepID=A0A8J5NH32_FUSOX|nr:hypothetical protein Forpe1208_v015793 [Fusarium oxysporum f. sp. rapae]